MKESSTKKVRSSFSDGALSLRATKLKWMIPFLANQKCQRKFMLLSFKAS